MASHHWKASSGEFYINLGEHATPKISLVKSNQIKILFIASDNKDNWSKQIYIINQQMMQTDSEEAKLVFLRNPFQN